MRISIWMLWMGVATYAVLAPTLPQSVEIPWHDQQRIGQIGLILLASASLMCVVWQRSSALATRKAGLPVVLVGMLLAIAGLSAWLSDHPRWAWIEVAVVMGCIGLARAVGEARHRMTARADVILLSVVCLSTAALAATSIVGYFALLQAGGFRGAEELLSGFENPRFFGHALLPLLILLGGAQQHSGMPAVARRGVLLLLPWAWTMLLMSGARGAWLAAAVACAVTAVLGPLGRRLVAIQLASAAGGILLYVALTNWLPTIVSADVQGGISERVSLLATGHLSRRELLWQQALDMGFAHPWLGAGPMHFAALEKTVASHPHNLFLQWFAELGLPSLILFVWLLVWAGARGFTALSQVQQGDQRLLAISLMSAVAGICTNSMLDGLHVMPYTQTWAAILIGWLVGILAPRENQWNGLSGKLIVPPLILSSVFLVVVAVQDVSELSVREEAFLEATTERLQPRFWRQGRIQW